MPLKAKTLVILLHHTSLPIVEVALHRNQVSVQQIALLLTLDQEVAFKERLVDLDLRQVHLETR